MLSFSGGNKQNNSSEEERGSSASGGSSLAGLSSSIQSIEITEKEMTTNILQEKINGDIANIKKYQQSSLKHPFKLVWHGFLELLGIDTVTKKYRDLSQVVNKAGNVLDVITTGTRTAQVYCDVEVWGTNGGAPAADSKYYRLINTNGPATGLSEAGWGIFGAGLGAIFVGMGIETIKNANKLHARSRDYYRRRLDDQLGYKFASEKEFNDHLDESYASFLLRRKIFNRTNLKYEYVDDTENYIHNTYQSSEILEIMQLFTGVLPDSKKHNRLARAVAETVSFIGKVWRTISTSSLIYWYVWLPFDVAFGVARACGHALIAPIVMSITAVLNIIFFIPKIWHMIQKGRKTEEELQKSAEKAEKEVEYERLGKQANLRDFMKKEKAKNNAYLENLLDGNESEAVGKEKLRHLLNIPKNKNMVSETSQRILYRDKKQVQSTRLVKSLLKGSTLRLFVSSFVEAVTAIIVSSFAAWLLSSTANALVGKNNWLSNFLDGNLADNGTIIGGLGLVSGAIYLVQNIIIKCREQNDYEASIHKKMCEQYKNTEKTKLEVYLDYEKQVEFRRARVEWLRLEIMKNKIDKNDPGCVRLHGVLYSSDFGSFRTGKFNPELSLEEYKTRYNLLHKERQQLECSLRKLQGSKKNKDLDTELAVGYDVKKINAYNNNYFSRIRYTKGAWGWFCETCSFLYDTICYIESSSLVARSLFLAGGVFASLAVGLTAGTGTLPLFITIAIVVMTVGTMIYHLHRYLEKQRKAQENFVDGTGLDDKISYFRKHGKSLGLADAHLSKKAGVAPLLDEDLNDPVFSEKVNVDSPPTLTSSGSGKSDEVPWMNKKEQTRRNDNVYTKSNVSTFPKQRSVLNQDKGVELEVDEIPPIRYSNNEI